MCKRMVEREGKIVIEKAHEHKFAWSGNIPCTGVYRCLYCGFAPPEKQRKLEN